MNNLRTQCRPGDRFVYRLNYRLNYRLFWGLIYFILASVLFMGCPIQESLQQDGSGPLIRLDVESFPEFFDDLGYDDLKESINQSINYLKKLPSNRTFQYGEDVYDAFHLIKSMKYFAAYLDTYPIRSRINQFIRDHYFVYQSIGRDDQGEILFTGYYEPLINGSLTASEKFKYPIYALPKDLVKIDLSLFSEDYKGKKITGRLTYKDNRPEILPYYTRDEIDFKNVLGDQTEIIAWTDNLVDLFFVHVQGSAKVVLPDGQLINIHYHETNGQAYKSIGKLLIDEEKVPLEEMSMQSIHKYLMENQQDIKKVLSYNPSYIFFKKEDDGPIGSIGVPVTPNRSIALDRRLFPKGGLMFIQTQKPLLDKDKKITNWVNFSRFALNQDTGGAIKGPGRADLFWGNGDYAEIAAGHMRHKGKMFFLVLKP